MPHNDVSEARPRVKPLESLKRTADHTFRSADDRLTGEETATPVVMDGKPSKKKQGIIVFIGELFFMLLRPLVSCLPRPSKPGASADLHDQFNLVVLAALGVVCVPAILNGTQELWPSFLGMAYFGTDMIWLVWDPEIVRQPSEIMLHHIVGLVTSFTCIYAPAQWHAPLYGLTMEAHSFFIILQRRIEDDNLRFVARVAMAITWIPMRIVAVMVPLTWFAQEVWAGEHNIPIAVFGLFEGGALAAMQFVWTYLLFRKFMKWRSGKMK